MAAGLDDTETLNRRLVALTHAVDLHRATYRPLDNTGPYGDTGVIRTATRLYRRLLDPPVSLRMVLIPQPTIGDNNMAQFPLDQPGPITAVVETLDRNGNVVENDPNTIDDDVQFSLSAEGPVSLVNTGDGRSVQITLNELGDTVLTAEVNTINGPIAITEALQVIRPGIAAMRIRFDVPQA